MATYTNSGTGVVHWLREPRTWWARTACNRIGEFGRSWKCDNRSWNWDNVDPVGTPAEVTCCKCRETRAFLEAAKAAGEEE